MSASGGWAAGGVPAEVAAAAARMEGFGAPWCVGGGWAVDLFLGRLTRAHGDVDLVLLRDDQQRLHAHFPGWRFQRVLRGTFAEWLPGERIDSPAHEIHGQAPDGTRLELLLNDHDADGWIFRRDPAVRCPLPSLMVPTDAGIPVLCPAVVLLYKAKAPRDADEHDFVHLLPALPAPQRRWLRDALARVHPGHAWLARL